MHKKNTKYKKNIFLLHVFDFFSSTNISILKINVRLLEKQYDLFWEGNISKWMSLYGGRESSMRCNFRKHMQIKKAPAN